MQGKVTFGKVTDVLVIARHPFIHSKIRHVMGPTTVRLHVCGKVANGKVTDVIIIARYPIIRSSAQKLDTLWVPPRSYA